jgi:hypothetical protein
VVANRNYTAACFLAVSSVGCESNRAAYDSTGVAEVSAADIVVSIFGSSGGSRKKYGVSNGICQ